MNRCRDSHAMAARARESRDSKYGRPMVTPAPARNLRLENLDFIAVILLMVGYAGTSLRFRPVGPECLAGRNHGNERSPLAAASSHCARRQCLGVGYRLGRRERAASGISEKLLGDAGWIARVFGDQLG